MNDLAAKLYEEVNAIFCDGILEIICSDPDDLTGEKLTGKRITICGEYDDPISLDDILKDYPNVRTVIFNDALEGYVYTYGKHKNTDWELVGTTQGYA